METVENTETTIDTTATETKEFDINQVLENPIFQKLLESHADKRVSTALAKKDAEYKTKLEDEQKKAKMTAEELQVQRELELADRETQIKAMELRLGKNDLFKNKGYDLNLIDYAQGNSIEEIEENAINLTKVINAIVEKQVAERLKGGYKPVVNTDAPTGVSKEQFDKMIYKEKNKMALENPELYKQLSK